MNITIVMGFFLPVPAMEGGATEKIWHRLGEIMAAAGNPVTIVSRRWAGLPDRETAGMLTHLRLPGMAHTRSLPINLAKDFFWGLRVARQLPPADVVICNTVSLPVYLRKWRPAAGRVAVVLGRMPKGQCRFYGGTDLLLATSSAVAAKARDENSRLADKLFLFRNPIDWDLHQRASSQAAGGGALTIGYAGRIHPEKGLEFLLDAAVLLAGKPDIPSWRLELIGPVSVSQGGGGEAYRDRLISLYSKRLGGRLTFTPPIFDRAELAGRYGRFDVFCYPSRAARGEALGIAPIEAMAAGAVPVVSTLDCFRDLIEPGVNGFQFNHESPRAAMELADVLSKIAADPLLRAEVAARARKTARLFDYPETARALLSRFESFKR